MIMTHLKLFKKSQIFITFIGYIRYTYFIFYLRYYKRTNVQNNVFNIM